MAHADLLLKYHQYQGQTNDCAPFSTAIVVNTIRNDRVLNGLDLAEEMNRPRLRWWGPLPYLVIRRIPNWATFPWGIADVLQESGIRCRWQFFAHPNQLQRALDQDRIALPIVGEHRPLWAHVKPLVAHHPKRGWGFADPAYNSTDIIWQPEAEFMQQWQNFGRILIETL